MEEDMVDTCTEHKVQVWLHLTERRAEMLCQPCECLTGGISLSCHMGCRRGIFQHAEITIVRACITFILAETTNTKVSKSKTLYLRYINSSIAVNKVCGRAVGLVACYGAMAVCPCRPLSGEILQQHLSQSLTVVTDSLPVSIYKQLKTVLQAVTPPLLKLLRKCWCPIGTVYLITVVEECVWERCIGLCESLLDMLEVMGYSRRVEMVDYETLTTWSRTFHLLSCPALIESYDSLPATILGI